MGKTIEIRDPIHGFIVLNEWEQEIVNHWAFQRLRRIRQLGLTDMVYPGAMHTRFEHSLGVMHIATCMYNEIVSRNKDFLDNELHYDESGIRKYRILIRISSLLHDIGHAPFSHSSEELMPINEETNKRYKHEDYSAAIVLYLFKDVVDKNSFNVNYGITSKDVSDFLSRSHVHADALVWKDLVSGQLDADRADYLLRDSHHIGVAYGRYDLHRLLKTMTIANDPESGAPRLAVEEGGIHTAEALIIARYMMFTQVYFHHTRRIFDHHITKAMKEILFSEGMSTYPPPTSKENVEEFLKWTDWRVTGIIEKGGGGQHGKIIRDRQHHRCIYETPEIIDRQSKTKINRIQQKLGDKISYKDYAQNSWYKLKGDDIQIKKRPGKSNEELVPLSSISSIVKGLKAVNQTRVYVSLEDKPFAEKIVSDILKPQARRRRKK